MNEEKTKEPGETIIIKKNGLPGFKGFALLVIITSGLFIISGILFDRGFDAYARLSKPEVIFSGIFEYPVIIPVLSGVILFAISFMILIHMIRQMIGKFLLSRHGKIAEGFITGKDTNRDVYEQSNYYDDNYNRRNYNKRNFIKINYYRISYQFKVVSGDKLFIIDSDKYVGEEYFDKYDADQEIAVKYLPGNPRIFYME